jgi:hypothetical protein
VAKGRNHDSLNKSKPNTAETSLLVSIVEAPVYAMKSQYESLLAHNKPFALESVYQVQGWLRKAKKSPVSFC